MNLVPGELAAMRAEVNRTSGGRGDPGSCLLTLTAVPWIFASLKGGLHLLIRHASVVLLFHLKEAFPEGPVTLLETGPAQ